jgi:hypothetical protein
MTEVLTGTVHIAGFEVQFAERIRQRCAWCGEILLDQELALVAIHVDPDDFNSNMTFSVWPAGKQVLHDGNYWSLLEDLPADLPGIINVDPRSCTRIPPELTIETKGKTDQ